ncbi:MAG: ABC transporter permease [Flammeovirgaceae bacterium]|nr:ABC transporter permease [Flammeovirgaceae bacterium]
MLKNYLITAFRSLVRQGGTAIVNISGLTLGITASLILFLLISHLLSYDTFHSKRDRIYRVTTSSQTQDGREHFTSGIPSVLPDAFRNDFSEAEEVTFISYRNGGLVQIPRADNELKNFEEESGITFAEPNYFKIFDRSILSGDATKGLDEPNEAIISKKWALKFYQDENPIGKTFLYDKKEYKVSAVMEDYPDNTDFPFELMLSYVTIKKETEEHGWGSIWSDEQCYLLLKEGEAAQKLESRIPAFVEKYFKENWDKRTHQLQPLASLHFDKRYSAYSYRNISKESLWAMGIIAAFLIITACVNFINIATAEAIKRSKEVGIRKTLGSSRWQLMKQFIGETSIVTIISVFISVGLAQMILGFLNSFIQMNIQLDFGNPDLVIFLISIILIVSLFSGLYPAFILSSYKPALVLKNQISNKNSSGFRLRQSLVVVQFFISQLFIIGTIVLIQQMNYFQNKDLGFDKEAVLRVNFPDTELTIKKSFQNEVLSLTGVDQVSLAYTSPSSGSTSATDFTIENDPTHYETQIKIGDRNYIKLYGLNLLAGTTQQETDTINQLVVNEAFIKSIGIQDAHEAIGKTVQIWDVNAPIVGVVQDFHTQSLENKIEPVALFSNARHYRMAAIKVQPGNIHQSVEAIQQVWHKFFPDRTFDYEFLDQEVAQFYEGEKKMSILLSIFTGMAIFIGCLGLFGLATFMANQKTKEIGVRKVLGASVAGLVMMFSKEFLKLILIGFLLAAPLAWFFMNAWLDGFAYKITLSVWMFAAGVGTTMIIALCTVGYRSFKAATRNPVTSLRYE